MEAPLPTAVQRREGLNALVVRRVRVGLGAILAGIIIAVIADHALMAERPLWADQIDALAIGLVGAALWMLGRPAVRRRPVPFALLVVAITCGMRALSGVWFGDVAPTAILCAVVAMTTGVTLPWGVWPQLASVTMAAAAIGANTFLVMAEPPAQLVGAVVTALAVSVALSIELQRHHLRLFRDNLQRRRAEDRLARLNAELERRVAERTAELAAATQRLEREAHERYQATQELRAGEKRLQEILEYGNAAILI
jgi:hypothetical protein